MHYDLGQIINQLHKSNQLAIPIIQRAGYYNFVETSAKRHKNVIFF